MASHKKIIIKRKWHGNTLLKNLEDYRKLQLNQEHHDHSMMTERTVLSTALQRWYQI